MEVPLGASQQHPTGRLADGGSGKGDLNLIENESSLVLPKNTIFSHLQFAPVRWAHTILFSEVILDEIGHQI